MVNGSVALVSLFYFYFITVLYHTDAPGKWPHDSGWIHGAIVTFYTFTLFLLYHADAPGERPCDGGWIRGASVAAGLDLQ